MIRLDDIALALLTGYILGGYAARLWGWLRQRKSKRLTRYVWRRGQHKRRE